jgi:hypothetical protein
MCLARDGVGMSEAHAKAILLLTAQLDRWRSALAIHSPGKKKRTPRSFGHISPQGITIAVSSRSQDKSDRGLCLCIGRDAFFLL